VKVVAEDGLGLLFRQGQEGHHAGHCAIDHLVPHRDGPAGPPEALANVDADGEIALKVAHGLEHLLLKARRLEPKVANGRDVEAGEYELREAGQSTVQGRQGQIVVQRDQ
jgi:hypothetical protein